jgi:ATP-dependent Lhr-like helicase
MDALSLFHPAVRTWFERRFPLGPTEAQEGGWPAIASGRDTLIAAPTGSGKTLAAFLVCIDRLLREAEQGALPHATDVVYVSPLKALASDVRENLLAPLAEISATARARGAVLPEIRAEVRSGDTPASQRASLIKRPPHILVTTPESLYLMLTAERSRETLRGTRTVIVDEIHATARDKRGSHLALSLERLEALCERRPVRIGLSATQRPIERIARLLVGAAAEANLPDGRPRCEIVDAGHRRALDLGIWVPGSELAAVCSMEQWGEVLDEIAALVAQHRTTLVFSNTRRQAERIAHLLGEKLGEGRVAAHHGSLAKERRHKIEQRLRDGELAALVATASLELGIDIGPVELVCQLGSPRGLSTFLQRVGRSGHARGAIPKGRLFPTTRDELVECAALVRGVRAGELDTVQPPEAPLDILAQQIVAACAAEPWKESELFDLVRRAAPYEHLARSDFDAVLALVSDGIQTGRGRRAAYVHRDRVNGVLRGRRGARLAAITSGGAIPETADYRVVADPDDTVVGTVNEDWAVESMAGDVFLLGTTSWQIRRVEAGVVRVRDAHGAPPTVPFWLGEAPARSAELSRELSTLRDDVSRQLVAGERRWRALRSRRAPDSTPRCGAGGGLSRCIAHRARRAAEPAADRGRALLRRERRHAARRARAVRRPDQPRARARAAQAVLPCVRLRAPGRASDDAFVLSLGPQHSFPLEMTGRSCVARAARDARAGSAALADVHRALALELSAARSPCCASAAAAAIRRRSSAWSRRPDVRDLPGTRAVPGERAGGPIELPDHPIVRQTMHDCLHEALDADGALAVALAIERGEIELHLRDTSEPSPLSHEILNGKPYTFLDDAPLEERRTRAVSLRRGLPVAARDLARLDAAAVARVREEAALAPRDADELHDALLSLVALRPDPAFAAWFSELAAAGRVAEVGGFWVATERRDDAAQMWGTPTPRSPTLCAATSP